MDLSRLQQRLRNVNGAKSTTDAPKAESKGVLRRQADFPTEERLYSLSEVALRRIGLSSEAFDIESALFIDTETTGLSGGVGTVAFLVGVGWVSGGRFRTKQLLMLDYAAEDEMLRELTELAKPFDSVVTFNGNAFDLPLLETRYAMNRARSPLSSMDSLDLLAPARRLWRRRLKSVRLSNLEEKILGAGRENDLPGSEAPERFFTYLRTGDIELLEDVLTHNRQDICSMAALLVELCEAYGNPRAQKETADLYSLGVALGRAGEKEEAMALYRMAGQPKPSTDIGALIDARYRAQANMEIVRQLRRDGREEEMLSLLTRMCSLHEAGAWPYVELAKVYEHARREYRRALEHAEGALALAANDEERESIEKRVMRIRKKAEKNGWGGNGKCL